MVLPRPLTLHSDLLARLVRIERLGELHLALAPSARWLPKDIGRNADQLARAEFARLGLMDRRGRLDAEVEATFAVLCRARLEYFGWLHDGETTIGVLSAAIGREAVLAIRHGMEVVLTQNHPDRLAEALVDQAPDLRPGRVQPLMVREADLMAAPGGRVRSPSGVGSRSASFEVRQIQQIARYPLIGSGELHVAVRDSLGRRTVVRDPLRYADTTIGRVFTMIVDVAGDRRIRVASATKADLVDRLHELRCGLAV